MEQSAGSWAEQHGCKAVAGVSAGGVRVGSLCEVSAKFEVAGAVIAFMVVDANHAAIKANFEGVVPPYECQRRKQAVGHESVVPVAFIPECRIAGRREGG